MAVSKRYPTDLHGPLLPPPGKDPHLTGDIDAATRGVVELQQDSWLTLLTDGELRRIFEQRTDPLAEARFLNATTPWVKKIRLPRTADGAIAASPTLQALFAEGVAYIQLDGTPYVPLIHKAERTALIAQGRDPDAEISALLARDIAVLSGVQREAGQKLAICFHDPCDLTGTACAKAFAEDLDLAAARRVLHSLPVDRFIFDCGGTAPDFDFLAAAPADTDLVLALIDNQAADLPEPDQIVAQIDDAAKIVDMDRLALIPRFGFFRRPGESAEESWNHQRQTLRLLMDSATRAWGIDF